MWKSLFFLACLLTLPFFTAAQEPVAIETSQLLTSDDGLITVRIPSGWYQTTSGDETQTILLAAETPERAATPIGRGEMLVEVSIDAEVTGGTAELFDKTLKDYGLTGATSVKSASDILGLAGTRYDLTLEESSVQAVLLIINVPDTTQWIRFIALADTEQWDADLVEETISTLAILPEQSSTPKGWSATIRAPLGWEQQEFSSFTQWIAPDDSPFAGTEVWFQAGFRTDLIGQGEMPFVLRSLGVNYMSQVDETASYPVVLGGLTASALPFESFTHTGISYFAEGSTDFGTADLIARAPLGEWTPAHQQLVEAMLASVQIAPPTADAAPVGFRPGYRAPDFGGSIVGGDEFSLADFEGKLIFVNFWFVNCAACWLENPRLQTFYDEYQDDGLVLLAVNALDPLPYIQFYRQWMDLDYPLVIDKDEKLHKFFGITAFPTTFVIAPNGVIVYMARGSMSDLTIQNLINEYLPAE